MANNGMKKVSVYMITYKQEHYVGKAIENIVTQETNFSFELVIGEDCSPDGTRAVCERYAAQYPDIIRLLPSDKNLGAIRNAMRVLSECNGEYIAMCEGDDYWTDKHKLQKQIDFLDANPDYTLCFGDVDIEDEMGSGLTYEQYKPVLNKDTITIEDVILTQMCIAPTATMVFRNIIPRPLPEFFSRIYSDDIALQLLLTDKGKAKHLHMKLATYRNHAGGITKTQESIQGAPAGLVRLMHDFNEYTGYKYNSFFRKRFLSDARIDLTYGSRNKKGLGKLKHYFDAMPRYVRYSDKLNLKELAYYHMLLFTPWLLKVLGHKGNGN
jgi:glycosyltransferase involved in cell wall biosynthesis